MPSGEISCAAPRFPPAIIQHAVWLYFRFALSYRDVEDLLAERGIDVSYETVRRWRSSSAASTLHGFDSAGHGRKSFYADYGISDLGVLLGRKIGPAEWDSAEALAFLHERVADSSTSTVTPD